MDTNQRFVYLMAPDILQYAVYCLSVISSELVFFNVLVDMCFRFCMFSFKKILFCFRSSLRKSFSFEFMLLATCFPFLLVFVYNLLLTSIYKGLDSKM